MAEGRLEAALARLNADTYFLNGERTENILKKMERQGYIVKIRERDGGGEESVDYIVGPRGKVEIGDKGVAGMVRKVYNKKDVEKEELDRRLVRSLGDVVIETKSRPPVEEAEESRPDNVEVESRTTRRSSKRQGKQAPGQRGRKARAVVEDEAEDDENGESEEHEEDDEDDEDE